MRSLYGVYCAAIKAEMQKRINGEVDVHWSDTNDKIFIKVEFVVCDNVINDEIVISDVSTRVIFGNSSTAIANEATSILKKRIYKGVFTKKYSKI